MNTIYRLDFPELLDQWEREMECQFNGHPGVVWYNPGGFEPDMHCKRCGTDLG